MAEEMKIEIISKETIKPSSPTPNHLKHCKLSLLDQLVAPSAYIPLLLCYPKNNDFPANQTIQRLTNSLSKTLTRFYPLAGRIKGNIFINCEDDGAHFIEARIHGFLSTFLQNLDKNCKLLLLPKIELLKPNSPLLLVVQVSSFDCGGLTVALYISHKFGDGATLGRFIKDWTSISHGQSQTLLPPLDFKASSCFLPSVFAMEPPTNKSKRVAVITEKCVMSKYVFHAPHIATLKAKVASVSGSLQQMCIEAITALIWRCAMIASRLNKGFSMHSVMDQLINFQEQVELPFSKNSIGNFVQYFSIQVEAGNVELPDLVCMLRKGIEEFGKKEAKRLGKDDWMEEIFRSWKERKDISIREDTNLYTCTSLCGFDFYESDFGFGKPIWLSIDTRSFLNNFIMLTRTRDGEGVEAFMTLSEEDMVLFKLDPELLSFAYPSNPSSLLMSRIGGNHLSRL